jgi:NAD+--asparagine ADP-ribosyltransferase
MDRNWDLIELQHEDLSVGTQTPDTDSGGYSLSLADDKKAIKELGFKKTNTI